MAIEKWVLIIQLVGAISVRHRSCGLRLVVSRIRAESRDEVINELLSHAILFLRGQLGKTEPYLGVHVRDLGKRILHSCTV